jgi:tetratricopeptide (TPR) repeat protein
MHWSPVLIAGLLCLSVAAAYQGVSRCGFVDYDDGVYVAENDHVNNGLSIENLRWALTTTESNNWHPLTWISLQIDASLYANKAAGYHVTNLLLHAVNTVLLFLVLWEMTSATGRSAVVAAVFGLHPQHVESVAWIIERKDVLSALFFFLAIGAYSRFVRRPGIGWYLAALCAFSLGLIAKPMLVTLPFVLLLLDYWPLEVLAPTESSCPDAGANSGSLPSSWSLYRLVVQKLPFFALSAACAVVTLYAQRGAIHSGKDVPWPLRLQNAATSAVAYMGKMFWPMNLSAFYPYDKSAGVAWPSIACLILGAVSVLALLRRRRRYFLVGWFWFLGTLIPVIGIVQVGLQSMADRYTYIPAIGILLAAVWGAADLFAYWRVPRWMTALGTGVVLVMCAALTRSQVTHWRNSESLWHAALQANPNNYFAHWSLATALAKQGRTAECELHLRLAIHNNANDMYPYLALGELLQRQGKISQAIDLWRETLRIQPDLPQTHHNLGLCLLLAGRTNEGIAHLREAVRLKPDLAISHFALGEALQRQSQEEEASAHLDEAYRLMPELRGRSIPTVKKAR